MYKHAIEMRSFACLCINALDSYEMQMNIYVFLLNLNVLCFNFDQFFGPVFYWFMSGFNWFSVH